MKTEACQNIDDYIATFPENIRERLQLIRLTIRECAPEAEEKISYQMPAFFQNGILVYFAAHKNHIGFYPASMGISVFQEELSNWKTSKGTVQFPHNQDIPIDLIRRVTEFRLSENHAKASIKSKRKSI
jgi:uncharacterized protein YdhG (YjbR/CyaY superfamily)